MSVSKKGKKLHKKGEKLPSAAARQKQARDYAEAIAGILKEELRAPGKSTKAIMNWTNAGERTVKGWIAGSNGPRGECLIELMRSSDLAFGRMLALAGRGSIVHERQLVLLRTQLLQLTSTIDAILSQEQECRSDH